MELRFKDNDIHFWCSNCDVNLVNIDDSETGKFYVSKGHRLIFKNEGVHIDTEERVIYAICKDCEDNVRQEVVRK